MGRASLVNVVSVLLLLVPPVARATAPVHVTYLWHLEQPIYWPAPNASGLRYQTAWDSILAKQGGALHPQNDLDQIFALDDRKAVYQFRVRDAVNAMRGLPEAGAQVSYSGGLIENIRSLGEANQLGYSPSWKQPNVEARGWTTGGGKPRLDIVQFPFHHALIPLLDPAVLRMELNLNQAVYGETWGANMSPGLFPSEMAFAEHVIPALVDSGIQWVIVSNAHLSRACADYPYVAGSGGDNIPPPNKADALNPAQGYYNRISIDRGVSPANAVPFSYVPHRARYVDPETGTAQTITVVPAAQSESWQDGYSCFGVGAVTAVAEHGGDGRPPLLLLAHDGDNAFGGGYSYYMECTPNFLSSASAAGHVPTTVQQYLADHPVPGEDVVHVESGAWVNADGDFGAPSFLNWNWPLMSQAGQVDLVTGWAEDERNWAVITAATNHVLTAEAAAGPVDVPHVLHPESGGGLLERAWHFLLGSLNSGYMYYGKALDMELKPTVACNEAVRAARQVYGMQDSVAPTIWQPQRYPDNPGEDNFGPLYRYRHEVGTRDFWVWTFVHDVSGVQSVTLKLRTDDDGVNPLDTDVNDTYAGGTGVSAWQDFPMTRREMPRGNVFNDPEIDLSVLPEDMADLYFAQVHGLSSVLADYYVEARDTLGHVARSPIQHVWVGSQTGQSNSGVHWTPQAPTGADAVQVFSPQGGKLHWGINGWQAPPQALWPADTVAFDVHSVETVLAGPDADGFYTATVGPFPAGASVNVIDFVIHRGDNTWDNNGGGDYHVDIVAAADAGTPDAALAADAAVGVDGAVGADAAAGMDAAGDVDAAAGMDAGLGGDAAGGADAGNRVDASADGGAPGDGGAMWYRDAAAGQVDSAGERTCDCTQAAPQGQGLAMLLLGLVAVRRSRRR